MPERWISDVCVLCVFAKDWNILITENMHSWCNAYLWLWLLSMVLSKNCHPWMKSTAFMAVKWLKYLIKISGEIYTSMFIIGATIQNSRKCYTEYSVKVLHAHKTYQEQTHKKHPVLSGITTERHKNTNEIKCTHHRRMFNSELWFSL